MLVDYVVLFFYKQMKILLEITVGLSLSYQTHHTMSCPWMASTNNTVGKWYSPMPTNLTVVSIHSAITIMERCNYFYNNKIILTSANKSRPPFAWRHTLLLLLWLLSQYLILTINLFILLFLYPVFELLREYFALADLWRPEIDEFQVTFFWE